MTRYEQGFMNKCAEYGVDGQMLLNHLRMRKTAQARDDAGIGMNGENSIGVHSIDGGGFHSAYPKSYYGRLLGNVSGATQDGAGVRTPSSLIARNLHWNSPRDEYDTRFDTISKEELENRRQSQARNNSAALGYSGAVRKRIEQNLIEAGKKNQQNYIETGTVPKRETIDRTGIEKLKLSPEDEASLLEMQNTMARNAGRRPGAAMA